MKFALRSFVLLLSLFLISCSIQPSLSLLSSQRIESSGTIIYGPPSSEVKILRKSTNEGFPLVASTIAQKLDVFFGWDSHGSLVDAVHDIRPDVICLGPYTNMRFVQKGTSDYDTCEANGWLTLDPSGNPIHSTIWTSNYLTDIGNPDYQQWIANKVLNAGSGHSWDGKKVDDAICTKRVEYTGDCNTHDAVNPRTGKIWTDAEVVEAVAACLKKIKQTVGSLIIHVNGIFRGDKFFADQASYEYILAESNVNSFSSEGLFGWTSGFYSESLWKQSVDLVAWVQDNHLDNPDNLYLPTTYDKDPYIPSGISVEDYGKYIFASFLLGVSNPNQNGFFLSQVMNEDWAQEMYAVDYGYSLGSYYMYSGTHVYIHDFSKAKVLVNPTTTSYQVPITGSYTYLDGTPVSSPITVGAHRGIILLNQ